VQSEVAAQQPARLLLTLEPGYTVSVNELQMHTATSQLSSARPALKRYRHLPQLALATLPAGTDVASSMASYRQMQGIKAVELDHVLRKTITPNDTSYTQQWHLQAGFGINAEPAWDISTGNEQLVVAVIDTGIDYQHNELASLIWQNKAEIPGDGIDNDGNGYVDDVRGINPADNSVDPIDEDGHGTQVSSVIAAQSNNNRAIAAVNWKLQLLPCRFMDKNGDGFVSDAIECLDYILDLKRNRGVNIVATNNSWGSPTFSQALFNAILAHSDADIMFVASAGNDNTSARFYPAGYNLPNVISVSAHDKQGKKASFANYGRDWVDLSAPGVGILTASLANGTALVSGTSIAAPIVSGVAALVKAAEPGLTMQQIRARLLVSGAPAQDATLSSQTKTGRLLLASGENQLGALTCVNARLQRRIEPTTELLYLAANTVLNIQLLSLDCDGNSINASVTVDATAQDVVINDDGVQADRHRADGIYSGSWLFDGNTTVLNFPDGAVRLLLRNDDYCSVNNISEIPLDECAALVQLYYDTQGQNWKQHTGWLTSTLPCSWYGITCSGGKVISIELTDNGLSGRLPTNFNHLSNLTLLDLSFNNLQGSFPTSILQLTKLQRLLLWSNAFEGSIPAAIGNLIALTELDLSFNRLSGALPSGLANLAQLQQLFVEDNLLSGSVPSSLGQLSQLKILWLENNNFSGTLPSTLTNLTALQAFSYAGTSLCAPATAQFGSWLALLSTLQVNKDCANTAPQITLGSTQVVNSGATVFISAVATDAEFNPLTVQWLQTSGPSAALSGAQTLSASFVAPNVSVQTQLTFRLTVSDGLAQSQAETSVTVRPLNAGNSGSGGGALTLLWLIWLSLLSTYRLGKL
jgi:subtilisin family serine protease